VGSRRITAHEGFRAVSGNISVITQMCAETHSYMRPCTPHYVLGVEHSIVNGRHLYATSTIRDTCYGIIHTFVMSHTITNAEHNVTRTLLRRLLTMWIEYFTGNHESPCELLWATFTDSLRLKCLLHSYCLHEVSYAQDRN
jgi:hypothetical protein